MFTGSLFYILSTRYTQTMSLPVKFFVFVICNVIGFFSASVTYTLAAYTGALPVADPAFDPAIVRHALAQIMLTWAICGAFSLAGFFLKDRAALLFLVVPAIIPLAYGLSVLVL